MCANDKIIERNRYDARALAFIRNAKPQPPVPFDLLKPYEVYTSTIKRVIQSNHRVLEIGAGTGTWTEDLVQTGAEVFATDISAKSLDVLLERFGDQGRLETLVCDMASLPFGPDSFDIIVSAGSLSYADKGLMRDNLYRLIRPNGLLIAVDSLNHNPVYRLNRFIHFLQGRRTRSTLKNMIRNEDIENYRLKFGVVDVSYFGSISFLAPVIRRCFGLKRSRLISDVIDQRLDIKSSAFKFVMVAKKIK